MSFDDNGFEIIENFVALAILDEIKCEVEESSLVDKHGIRQAEKKIASIHNLVESEFFTKLAANYLGRPVSLVRVIFFDKNPERNWHVSWHQVTGN